MSGSQGPLVVLQSFPAPRPTTNPFLRQLTAAVQPAARVRTFSWRTALLGSYDVFHVHWPERLLGDRGGVRRQVRRALLVGLLLRIRARGTAVVRTVHNVAPHEQLPALDCALLARLDLLTTRWVTLNRSTPTSCPERTSTVLHGHYRDWFSSYPVPLPTAGTLAYFGLIRPYKGLDRLLAAFRRLPEPQARLSVVGSIVEHPTAAATRAAIARACREDSRVSARLEYVDDAALVEHIGAAELVVLPYVDMHNSGAALLALSLDRPVLVPRGDVTTALRDEVGARWVLLFDGDLDAAALQEAIRRARRRAADDRPDLSRRDWGPLGQKYLEVYRAAVAEASRRRGRVPVRSGGDD